MLWAWQQAHPRHVAIVLSRLIRAAIENLIDRGRVELGIALNQGPDRQRAQIVCAYGGQAAAKRPMGVRAASQMKAPVMAETLLEV